MSSPEEWHKNRTKGMQGESLFETLIKSSGHNIIKFGIESHIIQLKELMTNKRETETNLRIKSIPDFLILNSKSDMQLFEIKTKTKLLNDEILFDDGEIEHYKTYWNDAILVFLIIDKPTILCVKVSQITSDRRKGVIVNGKLKDYGIFQDCLLN